MLVSKHLYGAMFDSLVGQTDVAVHVAIQSRKHLLAKKVIT